MGLIAAKCTQCGANIEIDSSKEAGVCPHCGTTFITEKAVINYNTSYVNNNTVYTDNIELVIPTVGKYIRLADNSYTNGDYAKASEFYQKALDIEPENKRANLRKIICDAMLKNVNKKSEQQEIFEKYEDSTTSVWILTKIINAALTILSALSVILFIISFTEEEYLLLLIIPIAGIIPCFLIHKRIKTKKQLYKKLHDNNYLPYLLLEDDFLYEKISISEFKQQKNDLIADITYKIDTYRDRFDL